MISFTIETQQSVYWKSVTWTFVLLAALCCCNGLPHQKTVEIVDPFPSTSESSTIPDTTEHLETTTVDLGALLDAGDGAFVTLIAGDTRLVAHRAVVAAGSPVLAALIRPDTLEASNSEVEISGVEGPVLRQLVAYLYTGSAPHLPGMATQLLEAAEIYGVSSLRDSIEQQVVQQLSVENAVATAVLAQRYGRHSLRQAAVAFISDHMEVLATKGWAQAVLSNPGEVVHITRLLVEQPAKTSATAATDSTPISTTATTPTTATAEVKSTSTAATPAAPTGRSNTQSPDAAAAILLGSLSAEEKASRLRVAAYEGSVLELRLLIAAGADVGARDRKGWTALHYAAAYGHTAVVQQLLVAGADPNARDRVGKTPLHWGAGSGRAAVVRLLLEASANLDARDEDGWRPLHQAALWGHVEAAAALLEAGADRGAKDDRGRTALDIAIRHNRQQIVQILQ